MNIKKIKPTIISFILDRSGSMESMKKSVIDGFNEYINGLKKAKETKKTLFSLTTFDSDMSNSLQLEKVYVAKPVKEIEPLTANKFVPRGGTPLYDAAVETIESLAKKVSDDQPVLVVIMTDGEENTSKKHDQECFSDLVEKLKLKGNWTFVFMGANQDSWGNAQKLGYSYNTVSDFAFNKKGIETAFSSLRGASINYVGQMNSVQASAGPITAMNANESFFAGGDKDES